MPIEFRCSQCNQLLRVPDTSAGKNARCPKCQTLMTVPVAGGAVPPDASAPASPFASQSATGPASPLASSVPPAKPAAAGGGNPFAADANINPYAAPTGGYESPASFAAP